VGSPIKYRSHNLGIHVRIIKWLLCVFSIHSRMNREDVVVHLSCSFHQLDSIDICSGVSVFDMLALLCRLSGIIYLGLLTLPDTHRLIAESFALVNSSLSEGMATAVLEVMCWQQSLVKFHLYTFNVNYLHCSLAGYCFD